MLNFLTSKEIIEFVFGTICFILLILLIFFYCRIRSIKLLKEKIIRDYGKEIDIKDSKLKMNSISSYYRNKKNDNVIDDITWNDLSMDDIYKKVNNTQSSAGREVLYDILRNTRVDKETLLKRDNIVEYFRENEENRFQIQYLLALLGESRDLYTTNCLFNENDDSKNRLILYRVLSLLPFVGYLLMFINQGFIIIGLIFSVLNVCVALNKSTKKVDVDGYSYMIGAVKTANKIKKLNFQILNENLPDISKDLLKIKKNKK